MKKILALVLCTALMLALAIPAAAVVPITANKAAITVDGVRDEAYAGPIDIATPNRDAEGVLTGVGEAGATGKAWLAWDGNDVYMYLEVYDKTPNHDDFNAESVEIFLDWNAGKGEADVATNDTPFWQVRVSPSDPETLGGYSRTDDGANWSTSDFEEFTQWKLIPLEGANFNNGYIIEIKIGAPSVAPLSEGKAIPFDLQVCDNSQGEGRDGQMFLAHVGEGLDDNSRWNTAINLQGLLTLGGAYVAPVAEVVEDTAPVGGGEEADAEIAPVITATVTPSVRTGDSAIIFVILAAALACAVVITRRVSRNKA